MEPSSIPVSGTFPDGKWRSVSEPMFIKRSNNIFERIPYKNKGGRTIIYPDLETKYINENARKYKLLESAPVYNQLKTEGGNLSDKDQVEIWQQDIVFTSNFETAQQIKITGIVDQGKWVGLNKVKWLNKPVKLQDITQPKPYLRDKNAIRYAVVDKSKFHITIFEKLDNKTYNRIEWCVPEKMKAEFKTKIDKGQRCWRGIMGSHALNFGESLFLHGTSNPNSIGGKTTHGCIRLKNSDIAMVYRLLDSGDRLFIGK